MSDRPIKTISEYDSGPKRLLETSDPQVSALFEDENDKVGILIQHLPELTLKQKVHALLLLNNNEFDDFRERRRGGAEFQIGVIENQAPGLVDKEDYIKTLNQLRNAVPIYETEAETRRRNPNYPADWDLDLERDPRFVSGDGLLQLKEGHRISYEEAVKFTRFENTRSWYRNRVFPLLTRANNPTPMSSLYELFKEFRSNIYDPKKPGTDVSMGDLLTVVDYYLDYEADNRESCKVHKKVKSLAGTIGEMEKSLGK